MKKYKFAIRGAHNDWYVGFKVPKLLYDYEMPHNKLKVFTMW